MIAVIVSALAVGGAVLLEMVLSDFGEDE